MQLVPNANYIVEELVDVRDLELVEQISPSMSLISSVGGGGKYNFPHLVSLEGLREGIDATVKGGKAHKPDYDLDIHYTFGVDEADRARWIPTRGLPARRWGSSAHSVGA